MGEKLKDTIRGHERENKEMKNISERREKGKTVGGGNR